jgi:hypothetical protein
MAKAGTGEFQKRAPHTKPVEHETDRGIVVASDCYEDRARWNLNAARLNHEGMVDG